MIKLLDLGFLKVQNRPEQKGVILRGKLIKLVQNRDFHNICIRQDLDKVVLLKVVELKPLSFLFGVMGQPKNILLPLNDLIDAVNGQFGQVVETVAKELKFAF
jgi:hypothetical protein